MSDRKSFRGLLDALRTLKLTEYGAIIQREVVHQALGIKCPEFATKAEFDALALRELSAIDYCRAALLDEGKYLAGTKAGYRILLPSENVSQVEAYMKNADRKLGRALKLSQNSPVEVRETRTQTHARIEMKRSGMRHQPGAMR